MGQSVTSSIENCRHCGLPAPSNSEYCCYGCELAARIAAEAAQSQIRLKGRLTFSLLLSMFVMMLSLFLFAEDVYEAGSDPMMAKLRGFYRVAAAILSTPVIILCGFPLLHRAWKSLGERRLTMDLLVGTGAVAAYGLSLYHIARGRPAVYFDSATSALLLATFGRYLEASARARASGLLGPSLKLAAEPVEVWSSVTGDGNGNGDGGDGGVGDGGVGEWRTSAPALIAPGARVRVAVDRMLPVDVELAAGPVDVNLGVLTGESTPRTLITGARVPAGAVPVSGTLEGIALTTARDSTLERLAQLAQSLQSRASKLERYADVIATVLVPIVWALAFAALAFWSWRSGVERGVVVALAVVLAACPCTYGVATPLALWLTLRKALEHGVLLRNASVIEQLARVRTVAFDKTGTLTDSDLSVQEVVLAPGAAREDVLGVVRALEADSRHPVARSLIALGEKEGVSPVELEARCFEVGRGVRGRDARGRELRLGSSLWLAEGGVDRGELDAAGAGGRVWLAVDGRAVACFAVGERVRAEAAAAIAELRALGVGSVMLTGDAPAGAEKIAGALGIPADAGLSAADKVAHLERLGGGVGAAAMVGDGLNDAPALARVAPGFAMDGGSGLARGMAQVALLRSDLRLVPWTIALSRRALALARRNLALATVYNFVFLGLALCGALRPVWAGLSMLGSSLLTLASSLRLGAVPAPGDSAPAKAVAVSPVEPTSTSTFDTDRSAEIPASNSVAAAS